jgi:hypothetical protein
MPSISCLQDRVSRAYATNNTQTTGIRDRSCQLGTSGYVHTSEHHWVLDLQEIRGRGLQLLRGRHLDGVDLVFGRKRRREDEKMSGMNKDAL